MKNSEELEKIIYDHARALKSYLICLGVGYSIADDIIQEVFVCFWKQQETKPENVELIAWLKGIAKNIAMNYFRGEKRRQIRHREAIANIIGSNSNEIDDETYLSERLRALDICLEKLPEKSKSLLQLRYKDRKSFKQIATNFTFSSESAIRMTMMRIRNSLKLCIEEEILKK